MTVVVRKMEKKDLEQTAKVIKSSIRESLGKIYPKKLTDYFCRKYTKQKFEKRYEEFQHFVAEENGRIIGVIALKDNHLRTFFVDPEHQGKGIGRLLYNQLEKEARKQGIKKLFLEGSPLGEPIYKKLGFEKIEIIKKQRGGIPYTDAHMCKTL
jgi:predicted N-acetyltransferase YhbS